LKTALGRGRPVSQQQPYCFVRIARIANGIRHVTSDD
jgi:hypothetical protein